MRRERALRGRWLLALLAANMVAGQCGSVPPANRVYLDPPLSSIPPSSAFTVDIVADISQGSLQAFDLSVQGTPGTVLLIAAEPGDPGGFDDDGQLFGTPTLDAQANTISGIVDLRHGNTAATGIVRLARLQIVSQTAGTATLSITDLKLADPTGTDLAASVTGATVDVGP